AARGGAAVRLSQVRSRARRARRDRHHVPAAQRAARPRQGLWPRCRRQRPAGEGHAMVGWERGDRATRAVRRPVFTLSSFCVFSVPSVTLWLVLFSTQFFEAEPEEEDRRQGIAHAGADFLLDAALLLGGQGVPEGAKILAGLLLAGGLLPGLPAL